LQIGAWQTGRVNQFAVRVVLRVGMLRFVLTCAVLVAPRIAAAHDFWLYPTTHQLAKPGSIDVRVCLGQPKDVEDLERRPFHIKRFEAFAGDDTLAIKGAAKASPAGSVELSGERIYTLLYESKFSSVELPPRKFDGYLAEEGLLDIIADRQKRGEAERPGLDSFSRYAKALVRVGNASEGFDRRLGLQAEIVAKVDPFVGGADGHLEFEVWYLDQPKAGALVDLFRVEEKDIVPVTHATSDKDGRVRFATPGTGRYLVAATMMRRAQWPVEGDWESSWASLTFEVVSTEGAPAQGGGGMKTTALLAALGTGLALLAGWYLVRRRRSV
jgi:LPXTG-motif cell wall-anchored protein